MSRELDAAWDRFAGDLVDAVRRELADPSMRVVAQRSSGLDVLLVLPDSADPLLSLRIDGENIEMTALGRWAWTWMGAVEAFPSVPGDVPRVVAEIVERLARVDARTAAPDARRDLRVELRDGRSVQFGRIGRWGYRASSDIC